jgi:hypothetical protein
MCCCNLQSVYPHQENTLSHTSNQRLPLVADLYSNRPDQTHAPNHCSKPPIALLAISLKPRTTRKHLPAWNASLDDFCLRGRAVVVSVPVFKVFRCRGVVKAEEVRDELNRFLLPVRDVEKRGGEREAAVA